jgi:hypothetical protein
VLGGGHEALDALGAGIGLGEVHEAQGARRDGAHADREVHARPLLHVVLVAREVDAGHGADTPLGIRQTARVAVHDRVVGYARPERVVALAVGLGGAPALLLLVRAAALLGAPPAGGGGRHLHGVAAHLAAARLLREALEHVGGLVDGLQVALVLVLAAGRRDVGMPALGELAPGELDRALVEGRLELQQEHGLLDVEYQRHGP